MGVSSLPKTVTRLRRDCDLNPGPSTPESSNTQPLGYRDTHIIINILHRLLHMSLSHSVTHTFYFY